MKLLVLTTSWPSDVHDPAGAFVKEMTDALKAHGFSSHVVALDAPVGGALATWQSRGRMKLVRPVLDMTKRALAANVDAVLSHWLVPSALIGSTLGLPHVGVAHGGDVRVLDRAAAVRPEAAEAGRPRGGGGGAGDDVPDLRPLRPHLCPRAHDGPKAAAALEEAVERRLRQRGVGLPARCARTTWHAYSRV